MMTLSQFDVIKIKTQFAESNEDPANFELVSTKLHEFANIARAESADELADLALRLGQLTQLLSATEFADLREPIWSFVDSNLDLLNAGCDIDFEAILASQNHIDENWNEYLSCLNDDQDIDGTSWDTNQPAATSDEDSNDFTDCSQLPEQVDQLLSALKQLDDEEISETPDVHSEGEFQPSPQPPTNDKPQKTNNDQKNAADDSELYDLLNDAELLEAFLDDATRCLDSMEKCSLAVEANFNDKESIAQFCRELHTLKGASASVGLKTLAKEIHDVETELNNKQANDHFVELMLGVVDRVRTVICQIQDPTTPSLQTVTGTADAGVGTGPARQELVSSVNFGGNSANDSLVRIRASQLDRLMDMLAELVVLRNRRESHIADFAEFNDELRRCAARLSLYANVPSDGVSTNNQSGTLSELSKDMSVLATSIQDLQKPISKDNVSISQFIRDFRHELMQLRRIPLSGLFSRVQRSARDAAKSEGKQVTFELVGEESGLERELQEKLFEPLLHIVRNAVSHGIETPGIRSARGKLSHGVIKLQAQNNSQMLVITITDDGRGLDYEAIRRRATEKGLISPNQLLNEDELAKLIFHTGFSTRDSASEISGRGVGMDVVMTTVQQLRGRIEIESTPGQGTSMVVVVPMRSGIEHVMVFRAAGQLFALPMQAVSKVAAVGNVANANQISMSSLLGIPNRNPNDEQNDSADRRSELLFLRSNNSSNDKKKAAFIVDEILGPEEVVVRNLPSLIKKHPLFSGLTLSGSGETVLLIDTERLANAHDQFAEQDLDSGPAENRNRLTTNILVVDDSMSARQSLTKRLTSFGFNVVQASDGVEGLEQIRNNKFDLVFTDLDMPRLGGMEMLFDLQQGRNKDLPVVVVSSRSEEEFRDRAMDLGSIAYFTKPVDEHDLRQLLQEFELIQ